MKKTKSLISFRRFKNLELAEISQTVINKIPDNAYYPNPTPALDILQAAFRDYTESLSKSKFGSKEDTAVKNEKRYILEKHLSNLSNYVNSIADGNIAKLESTGFPLSNPPSENWYFICSGIYQNNRGRKPRRGLFQYKPDKKSFQLQSLICASASS